MTIDFIPLEYYTLLFYNLLLVVVFFTWVESNRTALTNRTNLHIKNFVGLFLLVFIIIYAGFRPINGRYFGDTATYAAYFQSYVENPYFSMKEDLGFSFFMMICSYLMSVSFFFLLCVFLVCYPLYWSCKRFFKQYWFYAFLIFITSFSFWGSTVNGIRSGIATSFILLAFSFKEKKGVMISLLLLALSFHTSMALPVAAFLVTFFYNDTKKIMFFWALCIPFSLLGGSVFETFFASLGFDDRLSTYIQDTDSLDQFSSTGFRWDFLLYSGTAVYAGWYFIFKRKFKDTFYEQLFNTYLIANGFWILVIRASFSNRFAFLSWFMMGLIIIYPFLKRQFYKNQHKVLATVILFYFVFTYMLNVILVN
jgi:hypothetical protein